jgi:hypothetical protein
MSAKKELVQTLAKSGHRCLSRTDPLHECSRDFGGAHQTPTAEAGTGKSAHPESLQEQTSAGKLTATLSGAACGEPPRATQEAPRRWQPQISIVTSAPFRAVHCTVYTLLSLCRGEACDGS